jgi:hypothetical protein
MKPLASVAHGGGTLTADLAGLTSVDSHETVRIEWSECLAATWQAPLLTVTVWRDGMAHQLSWQLREPGRLPDVVRDRVTSAIVVDQRQTFVPGGVVRFVARRNGQGIGWMTLPEDRAWAASEQGKQAISTALENLRSTLGV